MAFNMKRIGRRLQKGVSLLEVLLSLSIITIVLIMATRYFLVAKNSALLNDTLSRVSMLQGASEEYKHANGSLTGVGITALKASLGNFVGTDNKLYTAWGNEIDIAVSDTNPQTGTITITFGTAGSNLNYCQRLASSMANHGAACDASGVFTLDV